MGRKLPALLDAGRFMARYWQRRPLLVRGAFPGFRDPLSPAEVLRLAASDDAVSRLVRREGGKWFLEHGPVAPARLKQLPRRAWTVLVQDANHFSAGAAQLLEHFDFIPHARIDDVMVSYAVPGGGVGPHVDSYDVFLLQGRGRRRWRISRQRDHELIEGLPLKVLRRFRTEQEWCLEAGDMLYLPPGVAHDGVAESECLTWSIGFRAPSNAELAQGFLDFLRDRLEPPGQYADPGARPAAHPGGIPAALMAHAEHELRRIRWRRADVREFVGRFASEVKAHVYFEPPRRPLARARFAAAVRGDGLEVDPRTRLLFSGSMFFINGERVEVPAAARALTRRLADRRRLEAPVDAPREFLDLAHAWYRLGYVMPARGGTR